MVETVKDEDANCGLKNDIDLGFKIVSTSKHLFMRCFFYDGQHGLLSAYREVLILF